MIEFGKNHEFEDKEETTPEFMRDVYVAVINMMDEMGLTETKQTVSIEQLRIIVDALNTYIQDGRQEC